MWIWKAVQGEIVDFLKFQSQNWITEEQLCSDNMILISWLYLWQFEIIKKLNLKVFDSCTSNGKHKP